MNYGLNWKDEDLYIYWKKAFYKCHLKKLDNKHKNVN